MILLLGGTSETHSLALGLAAAGYRVLVSSATDIPYETGDHPNLQKRYGRLDEQGMVSLIDESEIRIIIDATHPYASRIRATARSAASRTGIPYVTYLRPSTAYPENVIHSAVDHDEAARIACTFQKPIFLTIGVRNLEPYARAVQERGVPLIARVLPHPESFAACRYAGIPAERVVAARGPFTVEDNQAILRRFSIGVLVTKDSGKVGGVPQKVEAALLEGCRVIMVRRPYAHHGDAFGNIQELITSVCSIVSIR
jgi:precorrin-6A/cobalt-precorrin-6A reductase